jgi:preprotein translocase subunit SecG
MQVLITIVHSLVCVFLMLVVLLQSGRDGGMGAMAGGGSATVFGGRGAGNFLTRLTWISAVIFMLTSITLSLMGSYSGGSLADKAAKFNKPVEIQQGEAPVPAEEPTEEPLEAPVPASVPASEPVSAPSSAPAPAGATPGAPAAPAPVPVNPAPAVPAPAAPAPVNPAPAPVNPAPANP